MRSIIKPPIYFLYFLVSLFLSCLGGTDDEALAEGLGGFIREEFIANFTAEVEVEGELEFFPSSVPITIMKGESVAFSNNSTLFQEYVNGDQTLEYKGNQSWTFEGGTPNESTEDLVTVTYNEVGKYDVTLVISGGDGPLELKVSEYVCVVAPEPEPEPLCLIQSETRDDGRSTEFVYDGITLKQANKFFDEQLVEYSTYTFNDVDDLVEEGFYNPADELLGTRTLIYGDERRIINDKTENANGILVREISFIWNEEENYVTGGVYREPFGQGGELILDVEYNWNADRTNIISEIFYQNGDEVGGNFYEFDEVEKTFTGVDIETAPLRFNTNNIVSLSVRDASGAEVGSQFTEYDYSLQSCGRAVSSFTTTQPGDITTTTDFDFLRINF